MFSSQINLESFTSFIENPDISDQDRLVIYLDKNANIVIKKSTTNLFSYIIERIFIFFNSSVIQKQNMYVYKRFKESLSEHNPMFGVTALREATSFQKKGNITKFTIRETMDNIEKMERNATNEKLAPILESSLPNKGKKENQYYDKLTHTISRVVEEVLSEERKDSLQSSTFTRSEYDQNLVLTYIKKACMKSHLDLNNKDKLHIIDALTNFYCLSPRKGI